MERKKNREDRQERGRGEGGRMRERERKGEGGKGEGGRGRERKIEGEIRRADEKVKPEWGWEEGGKREMKGKEEVR